MEIDWFSFHLASYVFWFLTVCILVLHILWTMRDDAYRTTLWIVVVVALPLVGTILYLFTGMGRKNYIAARLERARNDFDEPAHPAVRRILADYHNRIQRFIALEKEDGEVSTSFRVMLDRSFPESTPLSGNHVELLCDGDAAYPRMWQAIESAKHHIHLQSFIIANDRIGAKFLNLLYDKAEEGVQVKVIYDSFGSFGAIVSHFFRRYIVSRNKNMQIRAFSQWHFVAPWRLQMRNHRKLLVVDGRVAFIGGINISDENFRFLKKRGTAPAIHDLHCIVHGPTVGELQKSFLRDWCYSSKRDPAQILQENFFPAPRKSGDTVLRVIATGEGHEHYGTEKTFYVATSTSKRYLWISSPYFVPDRAFIKALRNAALRGVDVRILVPANNNHWFMKMASRAIYEALLTDGVRIFERGGNFSHAKAMLVDSEWAYFGSSNCDMRSFKLNYELDLIISSGDFLAQLKQQYQKEFQVSKEITLEDTANRPPVVRLVQTACALFTPIL